MNSSQSKNPNTEAKTEPKQENAARGDNRSRRPNSPSFKKFIGENWGPRENQMPQRMDSAPFAKIRREKLGQQFLGQRLVIPAGTLVVRSNDTDYRFRPHSAFAHLTGLGTDREPDAVLVLDPLAQEESKEAGLDAPTHHATLYFRPRASRKSSEFYADSRYGELWVGVRASLSEVEAQTGISCAHIDTLPDALAKDAGHISLRVIRSDTNITQLVTKVREQAGLPTGSEAEALDDILEEAASELRLCKDEWEIQQMRLAVAATKEGFEEIIAALPRALAHHRGERVLEGAFGARARELGNGLGYETIAAAGNHAATLHWIGNDGKVNPGELVLIDAGVEVDSLYTADITRTLPTSGKFNAVQAKIYQAVLDAADAAFEQANTPGCKFIDIHDAAMRVIAARLADWGLLPCTAEESLAEDGQFHRRWMVHGTSHHLGIDVHDCAQARREMYMDAPLLPGMCFTIEPGLYFRLDDLAIPEEYRGISVRIEDDILVGADGKCERLSQNIARTIAQVEDWMSQILG